MKTEKLNLIKKLKNTSGLLKTYTERYKEHTSKSNIDKYGSCFRIAAGDNSNVFKASIIFQNWQGRYGDSSTYTFCNLGNDKELLASYFVKAINSEQDIIFKKMAALMEEDMKKELDEAKKEIDELNKMLNDVSCSEVTES